MDFQDEVGQVTKEMEILGKEVKNCVDLIARIGGRLSPVLKDTRNPKIEEDEKCQELVPLANDIRSEREELKRGNIALQNYLNNLEL